MCRAFFLCGICSIILFSNVSADEYFSPYDIPDKKELDSCSCAEDSTQDYWTEGPFFVTLTVANYGNEQLNNVKVSLYPGTLCVLYLFGTSEISRRSSFSQNHNWVAVPDNYSENERIEDVFPFTDNYELAQKLSPCKDEDTDCENIMIRFQHHREGGCPKTYLAQFLATITDDSGNSYKTNSDYPLKLEPNPLVDPECYIAPQDECGGHSFTHPDEIPDEDIVESDEDVIESDDHDEKESDGCSVLFL